MGHNNVVRGTENFEKVHKLVVIGHNNTVRNCHINRMEILGHNNTFKHLHLNKQPANNGFNNKFSNVGLLDDVPEDDSTGDPSGYYQSASDTSDSSSSQSDEDGYTTHNFEFSTNINANVQDLLNNFAPQNFQSFQFDCSDESSDEEEEEEYEPHPDIYHEDDYEEEEKDEEAHISKEERLNIINSINSFSYRTKDKSQS
mmetsp:Transcript_16886/g.16548  ORF Transcript_16886/g.16548 Transcript_16886/m.16548 type:complete len:200 (-) Transcript_16886:136-735(-)